MAEDERHITNVLLTVDGMDCSGCERNIEFALATVEGVVRSKADHVARSLAVTFDPSVTSEAEIRRIIEEIGYRVFFVAAAPRGSLPRLGDDQRVAGHAVVHDRAACAGLDEGAPGSPRHT